MCKADRNIELVRVFGAQLNGDVAANNNKAAAGPKVIEAATACTVLSKPVEAGKVSYEVGYYAYDRTTKKFAALLPSSGQSMPTGTSLRLSPVPTPRITRFSARHESVANACATIAGL